jgi:hypothetical protein
MFTLKMGLNHYIQAQDGATMRVDVVGVRNTLHWTFSFDENDGTYTDKISMIGTKFSNKLPKGYTINQIHPDHLALIALLVCHPFIHQSIVIPWEVSQKFSKSCSKISKYNVSFEGTNHPEYSPSEGSRPALAFSGGADSTACLLVMPENTLSVFMDRPLKRKVSMYNKSAAYETINHAKRSGFEVLSLECDVEYVRQPLGFPTDLVPSIPIIALASSHNIDSIAFGTVMESAYRIGHEKARDYASSHHYRFWGRMFAAAGLPLFLPVSGVSEVGTSIIVHGSSFHPYTRSCIRGEWPDACENCWKCFRKNMLEANIKGNVIDDSYLIQGLGISEVQKKMQAFPVSHENVLAWALKKSTGEMSKIVLKRLEGNNRNLEFLETYYPAAFELMPKQYQGETKSKLNQFLSPMRAEFWPEITTHEMTPWLLSDEAIEAKKEFDKFMATQYPVI